MIPKLAGVVLKWVLGPAVVMVVAAALGEARANDHTGTLEARTASLPDAELRKLEAFTAAAVANATWAFGSLEAVRAMARTELDRIPGGPDRARVLVRRALVEDHPDGLAALLTEACAADARTCEHPGVAARIQALQRFVPPGNQVPKSLLEGGPPVAK